MMKLTSLASVISCLLSFLAGLVYAGGFARAPTPRAAGATLDSSCDESGAAAAPRRVEARDVTLPDGRVAHVVMVDEAAWE
jgi:hypothetical protein